MTTPSSTPEEPVKSRPPRGIGIIGVGLLVFASFFIPLAAIPPASWQITAGCIVLLLAGIGSGVLRRAPWARMAAIVLMVLLAPGWFVLMLALSAFLFPTTRTAGLSGGVLALSLIFSIACWFLVNGTIINYLSRDAVKVAFSRKSAADALLHR